MKRYWFDALPIYQELVEIYSTRNLSYAEDVANAFGKFSSVFAECCWGIFLNGILTAAFSASLLWKPREAISRRIGLSSSSFLSWSWAGWLGTITYRTTSSVEMNKPSEIIGLEMSGLEIFVKEASIDSVVKQVKDECQVIVSDIGIVQDISLPKSPFFPPKSLSTLTFSSGRNNSRELLPIVDTLRFNAYYVRADSLKYMSISLSPLNKVAKICSMEDKKPYVVLFGVWDAELDRLAFDNQYRLVAISRDDNPTDIKDLAEFYGIDPPKTGRTYRYYNADFRYESFFNVMLVRKKGLYSERVAISKVFDGYRYSMKRKSTHSSLSRVPKFKCFPSPLLQPLPNE